MATEQPPQQAPSATLSVEKSKLDESAGELHIRIVAEEHTARISYCKKIFAIIITWLTFTAALLILASIGHLMTLESSVLIALISSTTVAALGLFLVVSRLLLLPKKNTGGDQPDTPPLSTLSE